MRTLLFLSLIVVLISCRPPRETKFSVHNHTGFDREEVIRLPLGASGGPFLLRSEGKDIASEPVDSTGDGLADILLAKVRIPANSAKIFTVEAAETEPLLPEKQTQAELSVKTGGQWNGRKYEGGTGFKNISSLRVPNEHTDHSYYIRYEGPGWESDKAAYRFYLDWRNGMDFFGKLTGGMVLQEVGQHGFDSYHHLSDWGMDLLKVGKTLGLGSIGAFANDTLFRFQEVDSVTCEIARDGLLSSEIVTKYYGWKPRDRQVDLTSRIAIEAGSALTLHSLYFSTPLKGFCTGLVKSEGEVFIDKTEGAYRLLATYGQFSLNNDQMGLALLVKKDDIAEVREGAGSHVVIFNPASTLNYAFIAVWEKGIAPVPSAVEFEKMMDRELIRLNQPLEIKAL